MKWRNHFNSVTHTITNKTTKSTLHFLTHLHHQLQSKLHLPLKSKPSLWYSTPITFNYKPDGGVCGQGADDPHHMTHSVGLHDREGSLGRCLQLQEAVGCYAGPWDPLHVQPAGGGPLWPAVVRCLYLGRGERRVSMFMISLSLLLWVSCFLSITFSCLSCPLHPLPPSFSVSPSLSRFLSSHYPPLSVSRCCTISQKTFSACWLVRKKQRVAEVCLTTQCVGSPL